jgi:REP element-mobilizing transposase RayT
MAGILAALNYMFVASSDPVIVNAVSDHVHILLTVPAALALTNIMRVLKAKSSGWLRRTSPLFERAMRRLV